MKTQEQQTSGKQSAVYNGAGPKAIAQFSAVAQFLGGNKTLNYACNQQIGQNTCWAAVTEAVTNISQAQLMQTYTNGQDIVHDPQQALKDNNMYAGELAGKITWDNIVTEINNNHPLILLIGPRKDAHYILLIGYNGTSRSDKNRIYVVSDPLNGGTENWSADEFNSYTHQGHYYIT